MGKKVSLSLVKEILKVYVRVCQKEITIEHIIEVVCDFLHIDIQRLNSPERTAKWLRRVRSPCTWPSSTPNPR